MADINLLPDDLNDSTKDGKFFVGRKNLNNKGSEPSNLGKEPFSSESKNSVFGRFFSGSPTEKPALKLSEMSKIKNNSTDNDLIENSQKKPQNSDLSGYELEEIKNKRRELKNEKIAIRNSQSERENLSKIFKPKEAVDLQVKQAEQAEFNKAGKDDTAKKTKKEAKKDKQDFLDVNLMPQEETFMQPELEVSKKLYLSAMIIFSSIFIVAVLYLGITLYQLSIAKNISEIEKEINDLGQKISSVEGNKNEALAVQSHFEAADKLIKKHIYWTKFFGFLEKYTNNDVYYTSFSMAGQDKLVISAVGKDYQSVAKQLVSFQKAGDFIKNVRIDAASADIVDEAGNYQVNFNINLEFQPAVFFEADK